MPYKNVVISGGGLKGYYFIGALKYLFDNNLLNIEKILGVSIGATISYLLVIGYDIKFIIDLFLHLDIKKYMPDIVIDKIFDEYFCLDCNKFNNMLKYFTNKKNIPHNITLQELYDKTKIELIIGTSNISLKQYEYISYKNNPKLEVLTALQMSYALPLLFKPIIYNNHYYVDGGLINNFPIKYFKNDMKNTIGITIKPQIEEIKDIFGFIKNIMVSINNRTDLKNKNNIIIINENNNISSLDFDNIHLYRNNMVLTGYDSAKNFYENIKNNNYDFVKNIILEIIDNNINVNTTENN